MANLATTDVTLDHDNTFWFGGPVGKKIKRVVATYTDYTGGGTTNLMPASAFGMTKILNCSSLSVYTTADGSSPKIYPASPDHDGTHVLLVDTNSDTETAHASATDVEVASSETARIVLEGY